MSWNEGLVDLSLFAYSPAGDQGFTTSGASVGHHVHEDSTDDTTEYSRPTREFYAPAASTGFTVPTAPIAPRAAPTNVGEQYAWKPLPRLPPRTICGAISIPRESDEEPQCILNRIKRKKTNEPSAYQENNILRRRNPTSPPRLTLSAPPPTPNAAESASEMIWMPEEQMWLIVGERERRDINSMPPHTTGPTRYTIPPSHSPPTLCSRSAPTTRAPSREEATPPPSPIQSQLQNLYEPRDEERLSPLFQEAMNSVPMFDMFEPPPPPTYDNIVRDRPLRSAPLRPAPPGPSLPPISLSPPSPLSVQTSIGLATSRASPTRTASTGSNYTTTPSSHRANSHRTSSSDSDSLSHSQTLSSSHPRHPQRSSDDAWTPNFSTPSRSANHYRAHIWAEPSQQRCERQITRQEIPGSAKSWHGFARKLAKP